MSGIIGVIPMVEGNVNDPQRLVQVAKNSYPLVAEFAMFNVEKVHHILFLSPHIFGRPIPVLPKYFRMEGKQEAKRLVISKAVIKELKKEGVELKDLKVGVSSTIGCPAMVNFGGGSAIKKLWDWYVEIAEKIYPHLVKDTTHRM